jgi:hypothetical protein
VTALSDIPIQGKMLIAAVGPQWCQHREEMIYTRTCDKQTNNFLKKYDIRCQKK